MYQLHELDVGKPRYLVSFSIEWGSFAPVQQSSADGTEFENDSNRRWTQIQTAIIAASFNLTIATAPAEIRVIDAGMATLVHIYEYKYRLFLVGLGVGLTEKVRRSAAKPPSAALQALIGYYI